ncbi:MAG TPA: cytochrome c oxidase assembly protein [Longimicrobiales bacterium]
MQLQWWCSAQTAAWEWSWRPYPGVWIFIALLALGYRALLRGSTHGAGAPRIASFAAGLACLWIALDWPIGALGAGYLASVHMVQFLLIALIAPPLLLWGIPPAVHGAAASAPLPGGAAADGTVADGTVADGTAADAAAADTTATGNPLGSRALRLATHPLVAFLLFNVIVAATHTPAVTDTLMATQLGSFVIDVAWLTGGLLFWAPVAAAAPARPYFHELLKIGYITAQAIFMTPVFLYLTFSDHPVYATYELAPPVAGIEALADQRVAGLIMKIIGGLVLMAALTILFFRWAQRSGDDPAALRAGAASGVAPAPPASAGAASERSAARERPA